jgi:hypothetical protein
MPSLVMTKVSPPQVPSTTTLLKPVPPASRAGHDVVLDVVDARAAAQTDGVGRQEGADDGVVAVATEQREERLVE